MPKILTDAQLQQWQTAGAVWPIDVLTPEEIADYRERYLKLDAETSGGAQGRFRMKAHLPFPWLWDFIKTPRLLDAVEDLLGPNVVCWGSSFFAKNAHDPRFISWHQDSKYYGLEPPDSITAWVALTDATPLSGCMKIIPGSHTGSADLEHEETRDPNNMLSRGQTVQGVDPTKAVDMPLMAGQMSIHDNKTLHSSEPNNADWPRIGVAVHFAATSVRQVRYPGATGIIVRGADPDGNWLPEAYPEYEMSPASLAALENFLTTYRNSNAAQDGHG